MAMSLPGTNPAALMACTITSQASSLLFRFGANPPSSPTLVASPIFFRMTFSAWKVSTPYRRASAKDGAPMGMTMNSWKSMLLSACLPPFRMFIMGTGRRVAQAHPGTCRAEGGRISLLPAPQPSKRPESRSPRTWPWSGCHRGR